MPYFSAMVLRRHYNYLNLFISLLLIGLLLAGCRKETSTPIPGITGYTWNVYTVQESTDYYINPLPAGWQLTLQENQRFSINLDGGPCSGTYSWTPIDSANAAVKFTIKEWGTSQYPGTASKFRRVLEGTTQCHILKYPFTPQLPMMPLPPQAVLQFEGTAGYFYVYR